MRYSLSRAGDHAGDSGILSCTMRWGENGHWHAEPNSPVPVVGKPIRVGSPYARTWTAPVITGIVSDTGPSEEGERTIVFTTKTGSTYTWRQFS